MYARQSPLSAAKRNRLIEHFIAGTTARAAAELVGVHRNTAASFYTRLRRTIAAEMEKTSSLAARSRRTRAISATVAREDAVATSDTKCRYLAC
jgi:transposase